MSGPELKQKLHDNLTLICIKTDSTVHYVVTHVLSFRVFSAGLLCVVHLDSEFKWFK